jgi:hypothetical protein
MRTPVLFTILTTAEETYTPRMNAATEPLEIGRKMALVQCGGYELVCVGESDETGIVMFRPLELTAERPFSRSRLATAKAISAREAKVLIATGLHIDGFA